MRTPVNSIAQSTSIVWTALEAAGNRAEPPVRSFEIEIDLLNYEGPAILGNGFIHVSNYPRAIFVKSCVTTTPIQTLKGVIR